MTAKRELKIENFKNVEEAICVVCEKKYIRAVKGSNRRWGRGNDIRGKNTITCSRECSKYYGRSKEKEREEMRNAVLETKRKA